MKILNQVHGYHWDSHPMSQCKRLLKHRLHEREGVMVCIDLPHGGALSIRLRTRVGKYDTSARQEGEGEGKGEKHVEQARSLSTLHINRYRPTVIEPSGHISADT